MHLKKSDFILWDTSTTKYLLRACAIRCVHNGLVKLSWSSGNPHQTLRDHNLMREEGKPSRLDVRYITCDARKQTHQIISLDLLDNEVQVLDPLTWIPAHFVCTLRCSRGISGDGTQHKGILLDVSAVHKQTMAVSGMEGEEAASWHKPSLKEDSIHSSL